MVRVRPRIIGPSPTSDRTQRKGVGDPVSRGRRIEAKTMELFANAFQSHCTKMANNGGKAKEGMEDLALSTNAFEALERDFQEVLNELAGDESLERFRIEYEKLHRALKKSHESEKRLLRRCTELNSEIVSNAAKVQTALKLSQEDQSTIAALKREIEKAWKMVDAAHEKEQRSKETIQQLKQEIQNISKVVEQGAGMTIGQESAVQELQREKEELTAQRDQQQQQLIQLRKELSTLMEKTLKQEKEKDFREKQVKELRDKLQQKKNDYDREHRRKDRLEKELKDAKQSLEDKVKEVSFKQNEVNKGQDEIVALEQSLKQQRSATEKAVKDFDALQQRTIRLQRENEDRIQENSRAAAENQKQKGDLKKKDDEIRLVIVEKQKVEKVRDGLLRKVKQMEEQKYESERQKDELRHQINSLERDLMTAKKEVELEQKRLEDLKRERDILNKNLIKAANATQKQNDMVKIGENQKKNLEHELNGFRNEAQDMRKTMYQLEKEREQYATEVSELQQKASQSQEEIKIREMTILDLQKKITENETKLKQQQSLYEAVRSDRNLYSKNLIEAQDEIQEMKRKFKIMNHQIEQLKEEIAAKEKALVEEHFSAKKIEKEKENLKTEREKLKKNIQQAEKTIQIQSAELDKLNQIINEADQELLRQIKERDAVMQDRDILGTQLIRRNDELALLYEKIRIQQASLSKGEVQYRARLEDIRVLKLKIGELRRELHTLNANISDIPDLQRKVNRLQKELLQERNKVKALSEELENPMNVHRWRKLEGSDPTTYEMIQKIQTLQKRLISKTEEVVDKDLIIQEKERLYNDLKNILAKQPGPEVAEQLNTYQQTLREKVHQMKAMAAELNMYQAQTNEYKYEIERLTREMQDVKKKYYEQKRVDQAMKDGQKGQMGEDFQVVHQSQARFSGGGFNMNRDYKL